MSDCVTQFPKSIHPESSDLVKFFIQHAVLTIVAFYTRI